MNKRLSPEPKCVNEGDKCDKDHPCCDDIKCKGSKDQGVNCDIATAFDSEECKNKQRTCQREELSPPKCIEEGDECNDEQKCCDDMKCTGSKGQGADCEIATAFDSEECKNKERTCQREELSPPKCIEEGDECNDKQKCCNDMKCKGSKGQGVDCDIATAFNSEDCKDKKVLAYCSKT